MRLGCPPCRWRSTGVREDGALILLILQGARSRPDITGRKVGRLRRKERWSGGSHGT
jgi:hypothetical protein